MIFLGWAGAWAGSVECPDVLKRGRDREIRIRDQSLGVSILESGETAHLVGTWTDRQTGQLTVRRVAVPPEGQGMAEFYLVGGAPPSAAVWVKAVALRYQGGILWAVGSEHHPDVDPFLLLDLTPMGMSPKPGEAYCFPGSVLPPPIGDLAHAVIDWTESTTPTLAARSGMFALARLGHQVSGRVFSSSDLTGGNQDGFVSGNHLAEVPGGFRLLQEAQPLTLTMSFYQPLWPSMDPQHLSQQIHYLRPGGSDPIFSRPAHQYFLGGTPGLPVAAEFVGNGGYAQYTGLSLPEGLEIHGSTSTFYHYFYLKNLSRLDALELGRPEWFQQTPPGSDVAVSAALGPFETSVAWSASGPGAISRMRWIPRGDGGASRQVQVRIFFDGHTKADVDVTLATLLEHEGGESTHLPMPYERQVRVEVSNLAESPLSVDLEIRSVEGLYPKPWGYLRASTDSGPMPVGYDFRGRTRVGRGKVVQEAYETREIAAQAPSTSWLWEGDPRHEVDGQRGASYALTGTEDFSYWGWYYTKMDEPFSSALSRYSGHLFEGPDFVRRATLFRGDHVPIHYYSSWTPSFEHGAQNDIPQLPVVVRASHTAFEYVQDTPALTEAMIVGAKGLPLRKFVTSRFEGDATHPNHALEFGFSQDPFVVPIQFSAFNRGLRLEWVLSRFEHPACRARIFFDDHAIGTLSQPWEPRSQDNLIKFFEDTLEVPAALSHGLTQAEIRVEPQSCLWNQHHLRVLSF